MLTTIGVGVDPFGVAVTPDGSRAYIANENYTSPQSVGSVSVIDTTTNTVTATIDFGSGKAPNDVAVSPDGTRAYVTNAGYGNSVSVIDTATNTVIDTIAVGVQPRLGGGQPGRHPRLRHQRRAATPCR